MISVMPVLLLSVHHGNKADEVVGDMNLLLSLAAGLVGCFYINRLDKLSESVRGQLRQFAVSLYPLDKLFKILCLSFLFFNNLLQTYDFRSR